ncbi:OmpA family protein [Crocinitomix catalasitica]|uniref:OmpA family protein n=1 Tax=Crocinitomix catalasitica TaxID=184607 RepID=UPI00146FA464|nr:OmpA family protein [Crocinitomix catalasitica]
MSNSIADCYGAVEVIDYSIPSKIQFPGDFGTKDDLAPIDPDFHEVNSVWLRLEPNVKGSLEFEITTDDNADFSYYLYRASDNTFCTQLENEELSPIHSEESSFRKKGISVALHGPNEGVLKTEKHDIFYLMIHTNSTYEGLVAVSYKRSGEVEEVTGKVQDFKMNEKGNNFYVKIRDKDTGLPVEANFTMTGIKRNNYLFLGTDFVFDIPVARSVEIESNTQGYFMFGQLVEVDNSGKKDIEYTIFLEKLEVGKKLTLEDIKFRQDSEEFVSISMPALKRLLDFMAVNRTLRIQIEGHVNAPGYKNSAKIRNLSEKRANSVKEYLVENGIADDRIEVVGLGNTQMLYEKPKNEAEEFANRRVEIVIID